MSILWQNIVIAVAVVAALVYVTIWLRRRRERQATCRECLRKIKENSNK